jgi:phage-related protein
LVIDSLWYWEVKHIWDKIYEIRIKQSSNISRVFYFTSINNNILLLDWILKKTQKLDRKTIAKIKKYKDDFLTQ